MNLNHAEIKRTQRFATAAIVTIVVVATIALTFQSAASAPTPDVPPSPHCLGAMP